MGRPKKSKYVGVHASHGVNTRIDYAPDAAPGAHAAAAAASVAAAKLGQHADPHYSEDGEDEEEDEEAAEFRREAAELLKHRQQQSALPRGLKQKELDGAVSSLVSQAGISKQAAEDALLAIAEEYHTQFDEWINEAMMWLALQNEVQDEAAKLRKAMEVSLREREAAMAEEAAAPPLTNMSEERLRKKFPDSVTLQRLGDVLPGSVLFSDRAPFKDLVKVKLVEMLRIEANCNKWWPEKGTQQYFEDLAGKLCEEISQASSSRSSITAVAAAAAEAQPAAAGGAPVVATDPPLADAVGSSAGLLAAVPGEQAAAAAAAQQGQQLQAAAGSLQQTRGLSSTPPVNLASAGVAAAAGALVLPAAAAVAGVTGAAGVSCRVSCGPDVSGPCSTAGTDSMGSDLQHDDGAATAVRTSKRKRQPPARYSSPSPGPAADSHKRQQRACSSDEQLTAKRLASLDCLAAGGPDSTARRSASPPPRHLQPAAGRAASTAASEHRQSAPDSRPQQDRGTAGQQSVQKQQQQLGPSAKAAALAASDAGGCSSDGLQAYLSASQCLSQLLDAELAVLRHHIYTMPDKAGAMPIIFQLSEDQQADDGDDSDVEVVGMRQPTGGTDIPEPESPAGPALRSPQKPLSPPAAGAAAAGQAAPAAAAAAAHMPPPAAVHTTPAAAAALAQAAQLRRVDGADGTAATAPAAAAAAAAAQVGLLDFGWPLGGYPGLPAGAGAAAAGLHLYMPGQAAGNAAAGAAIPGYGQQGDDMYSPGAVQYRASTNESGELVIEID